jgi:hypothetical protein
MPNVAMLSNAIAAMDRTVRRVVWRSLHFGGSAISSAFSVPVHIRSARLDQTFCPLSVCVLVDQLGKENSRGKTLLLIPPTPDLGTEAVVLIDCSIVLDRDLPIYRLHTQSGKVFLRQVPVVEGSGEEVQNQILGAQQIRAQESSILKNLV